MDNKVIVFLFIAAVIVSVFSLVVTFSLNTDDMRLQEKTITVVKKSDVSSGQLGLTIEPTPKNQNE